MDPMVGDVRTLTGRVECETPGSWDRTIDGTTIAVPYTLKGRLKRVTSRCNEEVVAVGRTSWSGRSIFRAENLRVDGRWLITPAQGRVARFIDVAACLLAAVVFLFGAFATLRNEVPLYVVGWRRNQEERKAILERKRQAALARESERGGPKR